MENLQDAPVERNTPVQNVAQVVPEELAIAKRWTAWKFIPPKKKGGKPGKYPLSKTNANATWRTLADALTEAGKLESGGVGYMMLGDESIVGLDLDNCRDPETGTVSELARALLTEIDSYAEVTPSGRGLRIFAAAPVGIFVPEFLNHERGVECYVGRSARFLTITGNALPDRARRWGSLTQRAVNLLVPLAKEKGAAEVEVEIQLPVPDLERITEWQELFDERLPYKKLKPEHRRYLEDGDIPGSRSERTYAIAMRMLEARYHPDEIFAVLVSAGGSWEAALDKRGQDVARARALVWADIGRAQKVLRAQDVSSQARADEWAELGLRTVVKAKAVCVERSPANAVRILTAHSDWRGKLALDITTGRIVLDNEPLDDHRFFLLQEKVSAYAVWGPTSQRQWWNDVVRAAAEKNPVNPREVELRSYVWDGVERLDTWFVDHVAGTDDLLNRKLGRMWLISCVARWLNPGCKVDTVLILQGVEGARKDSFFEALAGGADRIVEVGGMEREDKLVLAKAWFALMPEAHLLRKADRNRLKGFITKPIDDFRPPYAANPISVKRAFVFVSMANPGDLFNSDQDGLRRFWPVWTQKRIDYEWVAQHREQLLAEAVLSYDLGEEWWFDEVPPELDERVKATVEATAVDDAIVSLIPRRKGQGGMTLTEVMNEVAVYVGQRPHDRVVTAALYKHGILPRRKMTHRYWLHPSWVNKDDADVIPLARHAAAPKGEDEEVLA